MILYLDILHELCFLENRRWVTHQTDDELIEDLLYSDPHAIIFEVEELVAK